MGKRRIIAIAGIIVVAAAVLSGFPLTASMAQMSHADHGQTGAMVMENHADQAPLTLEEVHSGQLPTLSAAIERAVKAVEQGDKKTALAELNKARTMVAQINLTIGKLVKPTFANVRCPIMGSPIDPEKVTEDLTRDYKGQKVAFCCQGCPGQWDNLTDAQKAAKLAQARPAPQQVWTCPMHPQIKVAKPGQCPICNMRLIPAPDTQGHAEHSR